MPEVKAGKELGNKPIECLRGNGISVALWKNPGVEGAFYTFSISRGNYDNKGKWRDYKSFSIKDLDIVISFLKSLKEKVSLLNGKE